MYCCGNQTLYYSTVELSPDQPYFQHEQVPLTTLLKKNNEQMIFPDTIHMISGQVQQIFGEEETVCYQITSNDQNRQFVVKQLVKQPWQKLWRVLLQNQEEQLSEGDYFGFDGLEFQVYRLPTKLEKLQTFLSYLSDPDDKCRICFGNETSQNNPLLNFCNCSGSIKYMHLECCRQWIQEGSQFIQGYNYSMSLFYKPQCGICWTPWKKKIRHNKKDYYLFDFEPTTEKIYNEHQQVQNRDENPQIDQNTNNILFSLVTFNGGSEIQNIQMIPCLIIIRLEIQQTLNPKEEYTFKIGRSEELNDVVLEELFIESQVQSSFMLKDSKLFIKDLNSLYGTNVLLKNMKATSFSSKDGLLLRFQNSVYQIKAKSHLLSFLQPQLTYTIKFERFGRLQVK